MHSVTRKLLGESLREVGILVLVFVPLDMVLSNSDQYAYPLWMFWLRWMSMPHWIEMFFGSAGVSLIYYGLKVETEATLEGQDDVSNSTV